ncbi:hypothetical protein BUALT_Bualt14G0060000 [Buddleja alternifolia]|uniref:RNA-dependent RNA polymerase n=1 Tax=Buddleja alternifolia TaxID=168488 RepID=A0AAV6WSE2_9LAMI|nr:hypothetical protein BUALT_Bualt14G0060000 [Buddleja alternifolia]
MFAPTDNCNADDIRWWISDFCSIKNVAKYAVRLGQSFGSSAEMPSVKKHEIEVIDNIEVVRGEKKYTFSDGIGKISANFAKKVAINCGFQSYRPSILQIRYSGYKGVVALNYLSSAKLSEAISQLDDILIDPLKAERALDFMSLGENTGILREMLKCGYKPDDEPFLSMMLMAFSSSKLLDLRVFVQTSAASGTYWLDKITSNGGIGIIVEGEVILAKNMFLHPGDVRVLKAINVPSLHHMDVEEYFTNYIVNDNLGIILNAHIVFADKEPSMALSPPCWELARLFTIAVDFPKTGVSAEIPPHLRVKKYQNFMKKPDRTTYESHLVIGASRISYDSDMEVDGFKDHLKEAFDYKTEYDYKFGNLMDYYGLEIEAEILSYGIMKVLKTFDRRKDAESIGAVVMSLRNETRSWFKSGSEDDDVYAKASAWYHVTYYLIFGVVIMRE